VLIEDYPKAFWAHQQLYNHIQLSLVQPLIVPPDRPGTTLGQRHRRLSIKQLENLFTEDPRAPPVVAGQVKTTPTSSALKRPPPTTPGSGSSKNTKLNTTIMHDSRARTSSWLKKKMVRLSIKDYRKKITNRGSPTPTSPRRGARFFGASAQLLTPQNALSFSDILLSLLSSQLPIRFINYLYAY
jgi:hypothetical protein